MVGLPSLTESRIRLSRAARFAQLIETARRVILDYGTDMLTLGRLADEAGVTKPVVYDHFGTRDGLLVALYEDYDGRHHAMMDAALACCEPDIRAIAAVIASAYVQCVMTEGKEIPGVAAALVGAPQMDNLKRGYQLKFIAKCRTKLAPYSPTGNVELPGLWAMLGAADALSGAATHGDISSDQAMEELARLIISIVDH